MLKKFIESPTIEIMMDQFTRRFDLWDIERGPEGGALTVSRGISLTGSVLMRKHYIPFPISVTIAVIGQLASGFALLVVILKFI